jgi:hypothetical protein
LISFTSEIEKAGTSPAFLFGRVPLTYSFQVLDAAFNSIIPYRIAMARNPKAAVARKP